MEHMRNTSIQPIRFYGHKTFQFCKIVEPYNLVSCTIYLRTLLSVEVKALKTFDLAYEIHICLGHKICYVTKNKPATGKLYYHC